eukprot:COSAG06_NODE_6732_length_2805_cov_1.423873_3_plen_205_part_00
MLRISRCVMICLYNANIMCVATMRSSDVFRGAREEEGAVCGGEGSGAEAYPVTCVPSLFFPFHLFFGSSFPSLHLFPSFLVLILSSFHWAVCLLCLLYLRACQHTTCPACLPACPACLPACSVYLPIVLSCSLTNISCSTTCCWPRPHAIAAAERTVPTIQSEGTESMMARTAEIMGGESSSDHPIIYINHILIIYINHIGPQK